MKTAMREHPNFAGPSYSRTEHMVWPGQNSRAHSRGLESKKNSSRGRYVFLDFPFYRTILGYSACSGGTFGTNWQKNFGYLNDRGVGDSAGRLPHTHQH